MRPDWKSRRYAELVALGWNAGYSDRGGVGLAVTELEAAGAKPDDVTVDTVARVAGGAPGRPRDSYRTPTGSRTRRRSRICTSAAGARRSSPAGAASPDRSSSPRSVRFGLAHFGRKGLA